MYDVRVRGILFSFPESSIVIGGLVWVIRGVKLSGCLGNARFTGMYSPASHEPKGEKKDILDPIQIPSSQIQNALQDANEFPINTRIPLRKKVKK